MSAKYAEFQSELAARKQKLFELQGEYFMKQNDDELTREELITFIKLKKQVFTERIDEEFDPIEFSVIGTEEDILVEYSGRQVFWHYELYKYIKIEDYEMCAELRDASLIERASLLETLLTHRPEIVNKEFLDRVDFITEKLIEKINKSI